MGETSNLVTEMLNAAVNNNQIALDRLAADLTDEDGQQLALAVKRLSRTLAFVGFAP